MTKKVLITGIAGQDGTYLTEFLKAKNYKIEGIISSRNSKDYDRHSLFLSDIKINFVDISDEESIIDLVRNQQYDEIYNLASFSSPHLSFENPKRCFQVNSSGVINFLESIRLYSPHTKFFQASSSEMFGGVPLHSPQNEETPFNPKSPYAVSKLAAHWSVVNYREAYGLKCCSGILFNHESPRRQGMFVTRKISDWVKNYALDGFTETLKLGNLEAKRDWGHSKDYVRAMWMMLNYNTDKIENYQDYVIGTGKTYSIKEFIEFSFQKINKKINWVHDREILVTHGVKSEKVLVDKGVDETGKTLIEVVNDFWRPSEVIEVRADSSKIKEELGWQAEISIHQIIDELLDLG